MNYEEALAYIEQLNSKGIALGLERIGALLERLGNPQQGQQVIHVAGTNGKGSVCAFVDSALREAGLRVGRYSSPTLYDYRERIQINGQYIEKQAVAALLTEIRQACEQLERQGLEPPTVFEVETALAFLYFKRQRCDYVLLEVGMGGRLDSTNVIEQPVLSVITPISLEHTGMLGDSLAAIAVEKGGIIKPGCPVVLGPQQPEAQAVLEARCGQCGVTPVQVDLSQLREQRWSCQGQQFAYGQRTGLLIGLLGDYQRVNAAVAIEALALLQKREPALTETALRSGLAKTRWPGRFEIIKQGPLFVVDGAHNPAGAQALAQTLQAHFAGRRIWLLMGVFRDKDYRRILSIMSRCSQTVFCFQPRHERGLEAERLATVAADYFAHVQVSGSAEQAVWQVLEQADSDDVVVSCGSLSTIQAVQQAVWQWEVQHDGTQRGIQHETD